MRHDWLITSGIFWTLLAAPLHGQLVQSPYRFIETRHSLGIYAGYLATSSGRLDMAPRSAPVFGIRYDIRFTGPLSGEAAFGFAPAERTIFIRGTSSDVDLEPVDDTGTLVLTGEAGLRFHLTGQRSWNGIAPFLVGTAGFVADLTSSGTLEEEIPPDQFFHFGPGFALALGVGSDFFLTDRVSIRGEVRDYLWRLSYPSGISGTGEREEEWRHNFAPSLGVSYHF
jgi:hypothetical protein